MVEQPNAPAAAAWRERPWHLLCHCPVPAVSLLCRCRTALVPRYFQASPPNAFCIVGLWRWGAIQQSRRSLPSIRPTIEAAFGNDQLVPRRRTCNQAFLALRRRDPFLIILPNQSRFCWRLSSFLPSAIPHPSLLCCPSRSRRVGAESSSASGRSSSSSGTYQIHPLSSRVRSTIVIAGGLTVEFARRALLYPPN